MIITFAGLQTFKIQFGDTVVAVNPASKESSAIKQPSRFGADVALVSVAHPDFNGVENIRSKGREPFVIDGPGEYEVGGITITGISSPARYDGCCINTIYAMTLESINLCFLGGLIDANLPAETLENIDGVDILFVPIGGDGVLTASDANKLAVKLEAKVVIPCHYITTEDECVSRFLKEGGEESVDAKEKLTVKKRDVDTKSGEVVVLSPLK